MYRVRAVISAMTLVIAAIQGATLAEAEQAASRPVFRGDINGAAKREALAAEITSLMNYKASVESWKKSLGSGQDFSHCGCSVPAHLREKLKAAWTRSIAEEFNTSDVVAVIEQATAKAFTAGELQRIVEFRKSPLGQKVAAAEQSNREGKPDADPAEQMRRLADAQQALDLNPSRKANLKKIVASAGGAKVLADAMINVSIGTALGAMAVAPKDRPQMSESEIVAMIEGARPQIEETYGKLVLPIYASLYASLSDSEIRAYAAIMSKPAAIKFGVVTNKAFSVALRGQAVKTGQRFGREMQGENI